MITGSKIALARKCSWWAGEDRGLPRSEPSDDAALGVRFHEYAERRANGEPKESITVSDVEGLSALAESWEDWWSKIEPSIPWRDTETAMALDLERGTARRLDTRSRDYRSVCASELPGTSDLLWLADPLTVVDYKTGSKAHAFDDHEEQMRFLATCAGRAYGANEVRAIVAHVTPEGVFCSERTIDSLDMAVTVYELRELAAGLQSAEARPGLHCDDMWCPGRAVCPATRALLTEAKLPVDGKRLPIIGPITSNDDAYATLIGLDLVEAWIKHRRSEVKAYADARAIVAPDGRRWAPASVTKETPDLAVPRATEALRGVLGPLADKAIETKVTTSWDAIEDAFREAKKSDKKVIIKDGVELAREALRSAGALKISSYPDYRWRKPHEQRAE